MFLAFFVFSTSAILNYISHFLHLLISFSRLFRLLSCPLLHPSLPFSSSSAPPPLFVMSLLLCFLASSLLWPPRLELTYGRQVFLRREDITRRAVKLKKASQNIIMDLLMVIFSSLIRDK